MISLFELQSLANSTLSNENIFFDEIYFDSRNIIKSGNGVFFCFENDEKKAEKYINQAIEKKCRVFVSRFLIIFPDAIGIICENPLELLQKCAKDHLLKFQNLEKIAITGSNGKTILKEWIYQSLKDKFSIVRSPKSYNSQIGLPLSILQTNENHNLGIFECGISKVNEMNHLQEILLPKIGILTNIGKAHLENFINEEELIKEKIQLFKVCEVIIFSNENPKVETQLKKINSFAKFISFGKNEKSNIQLVAVNFNKISVRIVDKFVDFKVLFTDDANLMNQLGLISLLNYYHVSISEIQHKLLCLEPIEMRLEVKNGIYNSILLNDTFNADLTSIPIAIQKLQNFNQKNKLVIITDIFESDKDENEVYLKVINWLNDIQLTHIYCIGTRIKNYEKLIQHPVTFFETTEELIQKFNPKNLKDAAILIKGSRKFKLEKFIKTIEKQSHDTVLEVDLQAMLSNIKFFKSKIETSTRIMVMVKANSYGTGTYEVADFLEHHQMDYLGVAYADEGVLLRERGISLPIMVMNPEQNSYNTIIDYQLEPEIYSVRVLKLFIEKLEEKAISQTYPIHIKLDTGMHRLGFSCNDLDELIAICKNNPNLIIKSIFTHLASTDENDKEFTEQQIVQYLEMYDFITEKLSIQPIRHVLNSHGVIYFPHHQMDMIRIGIGMYGFSSDEKTKTQLKNVVTLKTKISQIHEIEAGESVSYNRRFIATKTTKVATLPIGYADGISRKLGNEKFYVIINHQQARILGTICMDMMMVDVSQINCQEGDEVIIYGEKPSITEVAKVCETITYEVLTSIDSRVKRIYLH
jgi:alanine racemase